MMNGWPVDAEELARSLEESPSVSVKINRRKTQKVSELGYGENPVPVKWCRSGFYLPERPQFTLNPLLHAGVFYVQEASSMIHESLVERLLEEGLLPSQPLVLDMCAAPGGKTTSMINALPDGATVVANEFSAQRAVALRENLLKWGYPAVMATNSTPERIAQAAPEGFDLVAVDAPCSGEGMMRKEPVARQQWSRRLVAQCAALQRQILLEAVTALRPGGVLIYSTCTFNTLENEENMHYLIKHLHMEPLDLHLPPEWGIAPAFDRGIPAMRFMPHMTRGEGLFAAVLRKPLPPGGVATQADHQKILAALRRKTKVILDGIPQTLTKGKVEVPASESVLATNYDRATYPSAEVDRETALRYLRHEAITLGAEMPRGYVAVTYAGHPLGLVKNIGNRANNLYPAAWKIRLNVGDK